MPPAAARPQLVSLLVFAAIACSTLRLARTQAEGSLADVKRAGALRSSYQASKEQPSPKPKGIPTADLATFEREIQPILANTCYRCHGPKKDKGDLRIDTLDPDFFAGDDVDWWLEVLAVITNGEMPPADDVLEGHELNDQERSRVIQWLSKESQLASRARRATGKHSSFRRMARYEYEYALQDLLGLPYSFGEDLPPDPTSDDGFQNSSETLHLTSIQFEAYLESARRALQLATVSGDQPAPQFWSVSMADAMAFERELQDTQFAKIRKDLADKPDALKKRLEDQKKRYRVRPRRTHYRDPITGRSINPTWRYHGAKYAWAPTTTLGARMPTADAKATVAVIPPKQSLVVELGHLVPERGTLRVRVRAWRQAPPPTAQEHQPAPRLRLLYGWQASNDSRANVDIEAQEHVVQASPEEPGTYEWRIPLSQIYPRNLVRKTSKLGAMPSPSEYLKLVNSSLGDAVLEVEHIEVTAPFYKTWPPASHSRIFVPNRRSRDAESDYARDILSSFMARAWLRDVAPDEVDRKLRRFERLRPSCDSFEQAVVETLASTLASPHFLYATAAEKADGRLADNDLAHRMARFLWCSTPDDALLEAAGAGDLGRAEGLAAQIERMLKDEKSARFAKHFVGQWLGLELLEFLHVDRKLHPKFDAQLRKAMAAEPAAFFRELLRKDLSVLDFLHCDFAMVNERLARHYGIEGVYGSEFRRVELAPNDKRGGLLTQAGLLAMNSDGIDSHPLKRGIWMLERLLNDPPPPPPPAVPEIDLADPAIAKMTLKERIENHRNAPACMSCHAKIDPWGIAFEHFDAIGSWRDDIHGKPIDAKSELFNKQTLDGVDGLKRFLLRNRQDQFVRALIVKMTTFALGRPLTFSDRAAIDEIATEVRTRGDGLATLIGAIVRSRLFQTP
ncbi:MAG: DUF1592 domain-containing protein [Planctomycetota bacterium]